MIHESSGDPAPATSTDGAPPVPGEAAVRAPRTGWALGYLLAQAGLAVNDAVTVAAREMGVPASDLNALYTLSVHGPLPAKTLARLLYLQQSSVTQIADRLEAAGLLRRVRDTADRRRVWLSPTPGAADLLERAGRHVGPQVLAVFAGLDPDARTTLTVLLEDVVEPWLRRQLPVDVPAHAPPIGEGREAS